jgi:hypothetical protein
MEGHSTVVRDVHWHPFKPEIISSGVYHLLLTVLFTLLVGRSIYEMGLQAAVTNHGQIMLFIQFSISITYYYEVLQSYLS